MVNQTTDRRYTINCEYCGYAEPRYVARFCDEWIGQDKTRADASALISRHKTARARQESK